MAEIRRAVSPAAAWFLYSDGGEPMGRVYRQTEDEAVPKPGDRVADVPGRGPLQVVSFDELASACILRRFKVVVRQVE